MLKEIIVNDSQQALLNTKHGRVLASRVLASPKLDFRPLEAIRGRPFFMFLSAFMRAEFLSDADHEVYK